MEFLKRVQFPTKPVPYLPMVELFRADLQDGNHTLLFNLTDIQGERALGIDFITYNASFNHVTPPHVGRPACQHGRRNLA
jgi:hypothetical protein